MKKVIIAFLSAALFFAGGLLFLNQFLRKDIVFENTFNQSEEKETVIFAVGDIMLDRGVKYMVGKYGSMDYKFPFLNVADYLERADIVFGNLESQISDKGYKIGSVNSFRAEPAAIEALKSASFDVLSVSNNHSLDYTFSALEDSIKRLSEAGIVYVGAGLSDTQAYGLKIIEKNNIKIGFLAYCLVGSKAWAASQDSGGISFLMPEDIEEIKRDIKTAESQVDILIVSAHAGEEYQNDQNNFQKDTYMSFVDSGADIVIGHHPHVIQPVEKYKNSWIAYSLGNFVFDQGFSKETLEGLLLDIRIKGKKIEEVGSKKIRMNGYFQPEVAFDQID